MLRHTLTAVARALNSLVLAATLSQAAPAQTFSTVYNFGTQAGDPAFPQFSGIVAQGQDGNLYSTSPSGGANDLGAAFRLTPAGALTVIHSFDSAEGSPFGGLTLGTDGNFYGTTANGGTLGFGTIFRITPSGTLKVLHSFSYVSDGAIPKAPPIQGIDGNYYGTTTDGGSGNGVIYKITSSGKFKMIHQFDFADGYQPNDPLVLGDDGSFYGTTREGGTSSEGVAFVVTPSGKVTALFNFDVTHGAQPDGPLVQGSDGNFYGTTTIGGSLNGGVIFKVTPARKLTVLHNIDGSAEGGEPLAGLVQATDGNLYGVNSDGGAIGSGVIFRVTPTGNYSALYNFDGRIGADPMVTPLQHTSGVLYGDTRAGGDLNCDSGCGMVYGLNVGLGPFVSMLPSLTSGKVGLTTQVLGQGFTGTTAVSFDGTSASFSVVSNTFLTATVPNGAGTGTVTVTTPNGTLTSNKTFRVIPQVKSFAPPTGPVGSEVVITGVSLKQATKVAFGTKSASFTVNSDTQVTATVPSGAKTGKITVTTPGGVAKSATSFTVTS